MSARDRRVDDALHIVLSGDDAPRGAVIGIADSAGRASGARGVANAAGVAVTVDTAFDVASVTKVAATTTALLRLASLGELAFGDRISTFLGDSPCAPDATLRDLLQHRAGLWEWQPLYLGDGEPFDQIAALPLRYPPSAGRHYSDLGFMLLGRVIENVAGSDLASAVRTLVTAPLGLTRTGYAPVASPVAASALGDTAERRMVSTGQPYPILTDRRDFPWREEEIAGVANDGNCAHAFGGVAGHAGLFSTVDDLLTLALALAAPDAHGDLWSADLVADTFRDGPDAGQALGWRSDEVIVDAHRRRVLWHPGFTGCALGVLPASGSAVVVLSNRLLAPVPRSTQGIWQQVLPALLGADASRTTEGTRTS
ncbi:MAG: serine hydrolase domain-containing protein [Actinomycetota bacterium]